MRPLLVLGIASFSLLAVTACSSDDTPGVSSDAGAITPPSDASTTDGAVATEAGAEAAAGSGGGCLDSKSSGDGMPYTCDTFLATTTEDEKVQACGAFTRIEACPAGATYRCADAKSLVAPTVRTDRLYYLVQKPSADQATSEDCSAREGTYSKL